MRVSLIRFSVALLVVLSLTIVPLPELIAPYRPFWVLLFVLYVQFFLPHYFRVTTLFLLGLLLDALLSSVMGECTCALLLTSWIASTKARRFRFFSPAQQMMFILIFSAVYAATLVFFDAILGHSYAIRFVPGLICTNLLVWPWIKLTADRTLFETRYKRCS